MLFSIWLLVLVSIVRSLIGLGVGLSEEDKPGVSHYENTINGIKEGFDAIREKFNNLCCSSQHKTAEAKGKEEEERQVGKGSGNDQMSADNCSDNITNNSSVKISNSIRTSSAAASKAATKMMTLLRTDSIMNKMVAPVVHGNSFVPQEDLSREEAEARDTARVRDVLGFLLKFRQDYGADTTNMHHFVINTSIQEFFRTTFNINMVEHMDNIVGLNDSIALYLTWLSIIFILQFFRYASFKHEVAIVTETLKVSGGKMIPLASVFMVVLIAYATLAYMLYGSALPEFSSVSVSIATLFLSSFTVKDCEYIICIGYSCSVLYKPY